jgi:glycosyltransferase A (GT-A) superfamily protein (DUF2064 family)
MTNASHRQPPEAGRGLLLIAAREPAPGMTKTRLGATIGMARAAELYAAFLVDLAARFTPSQGEDMGFDTGWAFTPADVDFACVLQRIGCDSPAPAARFVAQHGDGWDLRQANILAWGHEQGYERTVLIGSDSPQLPFSVVSDALVALLDHDVAIGRTLDGGYYLIGMRGFHDVLRGVPMSTITAAEAVAARTRDLGLRLAELPVTFDIDEERDLEHLRRALAPDGACAPATWVALRRLGLAGMAGGCES